MMRLYKIRTVFLVLLILFSLTPNISQAKIDPDLEIRSDNFQTIYKSIVAYIMNNFGVYQYIGQPNEIFTGLDQGFGIVTLLQLFDIFQQNEFLTAAEQLSDVIFTKLQDPRYELIGSYYSTDDGFLSNYRNSLDNILIAWGLDKLLTRTDPNDPSKVELYKNRALSITNNLDKFVNSDYFVDQYRVDTPVLSSKFFSFTNLMISFIMLESKSQLFVDYQNIVLDIVDFMAQNMVSEDGGAYSIYFNGYHDNVISLRNTALFAAINLELYKQTQEQIYLTNGENSLSFIKNNLADLGVTQGYFETIVDGELTQLSKSLFSHAILLLAFTKLANLGDESAELSLLSLWNTLNTYFRKDQSSQTFYSTIDRNGQPASEQIRSIDYLMIIFCLSQFSSISHVKLASTVDFRDEQLFHITYILPDQVQSSAVLKFGNTLKAEKPLLGNGNLSTVDISQSLKRPSGDSYTQDFSIELKTYNLITDKILFNFEITANVGIELNPSVIMLLSAVLIIFFVLLMNELSRSMAKKPAVRGV